MDPFVGEIRMFAGTFAPRGWAFCNGQLMPIAQNTALFSLLGTTYGGDGKTNFALPDLQGRAPLQPRQGPGLMSYDLGQSGGESNVVLNSTHLPSHSHEAAASSAGGSQSAPQAGLWASAGRGRPPLYTDAANGTVAMAGSALSTAGGGQPHNNMQPFLAVSFIIAMQGVFPARP